MLAAIAATWARRRRPAPLLDARGYRGADNVVPANISDVPGLVASGRLPIDIVLLQVSGADDAGRYDAGLGVEHLIGR
jgi:acyl-CoA hydrolase